MNPFIIFFFLLSNHLLQVSASSILDWSRITSSFSNDRCTGPNVIKSSGGVKHIRPIGVAKPLMLSVNPGHGSISVPPVTDLTLPASDSVSRSNISRKRALDQISVQETLSLADVIDMECKKFKFKKQERTDQLKRTLELIAQNDQLLYTKDRNNFFEIMGCSYNNFRKFYLMRFWIMFGADNLIPESTGKPLDFGKEFDYGFEEATRYLLATKPLDQVFRTLACASVFRFDPEISAKMQDAVLEKYPGLSNIQKIMVRLFGNAHDLFELHKSFSNSADSESGFKDLVNFICGHQITIPSDHEFLIRLPLEYPQYFCNLPSALKYGMIQAIIRVDDPDTLTQILILDPESYLRPDDSSHAATIFGRLGGNTILHYAIQIRACKCIRMILETLPELATLAIPDRVTPALKYAIGLNSSEFLQIIPEFPFIRYDLVLEGHNQMNLLQFALFREAFDYFKFFVEQAGISEARQQIRAQWPTDVSILLLLHASNKRDLVNYVIELTEINLNSTVQV